MTNSQNKKLVSGAFVQTVLLKYGQCIQRCKSKMVKAMGECCDIFVFVDAMTFPSLVTLTLHQ